ncbi:MAG: EscU/YscU/HrcU family type III secretion system export apparatus switch protein [Primorskyibacter sp.]
MSQQGDDDSDKSQEPTQKKLDDARKKGEIVRSNDVSTAAVYAGFWIALSLFGAAWVQSIGTGLTAMLERPAEMARYFMTSPATTSVGAMILTFAPPIGAWLTLPGIGVIVLILAQRGFVFAPSKLHPKGSRISIISNAKNKFGRSGLFEFFKSFAKLTLYSVCLALYIRLNLDRMLGAVLMEHGQIVLTLVELCLEVLLIIVLVSIVLAVIDYSWQHSDFMRRNRMSHKEVRDEHKEAEGDPTFKAQRRQRAQEIAMNQMLADVPKADVVIVNPTHFAVALQWDGTRFGAPLVVAKGVDEIARAIRDLATDSGVPIHSDPPTARAIYASVEIGQEVGADLYGPVAVAIRFARDARAKSKTRGW